MSFMLICLFNYGQSSSQWKSFLWKRNLGTNYIIKNLSTGNAGIGVNITFSTYGTEHLWITSKGDLDINILSLFNTKVGITNKNLIKPTLLIIEVNKLPLLIKGVGFNQRHNLGRKSSTITITEFQQKFYKEGNARIHIQGLRASGIPDKDVAFTDSLQILISMVELGLSLCQ